MLQSINAYRIRKKFTISGSPDFSKCIQNYAIEGPGIQFTASTEEADAPHQCLSLDGYSLKVYTTKDLTNYDEGTPINGVVRNVAFTNTATDTIIQSPCTVPPEPEIPDEAVIFLSTFRPNNKPLVLGLNGKLFKDIILSKFHTIYFVSMI